MQPVLALPSFLLIIYCIQGTDSVLTVTEYNATQHEQGLAVSHL